MKRLDIMDRLTREAGLLGEPLPGVPLVEIGADRRVLIENHNGLTEYGEEKICVRVKFGHICICGAGLELASMTKAQLVISGRIDSVTLMRGRE